MFFTTCLPRMRGDRPRKHERFSSLIRFTPHARGSTPHTHEFVYVDTVYPACAGIDLAGIGDFEEPGCLPRMRGDRPLLEGWDTHMLLFTPHARGSTLALAMDVFGEKVYPACAGIDPNLRTGRPSALGLPRMRGDRPGYRCSSGNAPQFTPHARGSTLVPSG